MVGQSGDMTIMHIAYKASGSTVLRRDSRAYCTWLWFDSHVVWQSCILHIKPVVWQSWGVTVMHTAQDSDVTVMRRDNQAYCIRLRYNYAAWQYAYCKWLWCDSQVTDVTVIRLQQVRPSAHACQLWNRIVEHGRFRRMRSSSRASIKTFRIRGASWWCLDRWSVNTALSTHDSRARIKHPYNRCRAIPLRLPTAVGARYSTAVGDERDYIRWWMSETVRGAALRRRITQLRPKVSIEALTVTMTTKGLIGAPAWCSRSVLRLFAPDRCSRPVLQPGAPSRCFRSVRWRLVKD